LIRSGINAETVNHVFKPTAVPPLHFSQSLPPGVVDAQSSDIFLHLLRIMCENTLRLYGNCLAETHTKSEQQRPVYRSKRALGGSLWDENLFNTNARRGQDMPWSWRLHDDVHSQSKWRT
jgi:hypothetical protein